MKLTKKRRIPWYGVLLLIILIIGLLPRAVEVIGGNYLFGYDQGLFFEKVRRIAVDHKFTLIGEEVGGQGGFFQGPGFYYLLSLPFLLFRGDPYGAMVLIFVIGAATLITAALLSRRLLGAPASLCITLLMAVSPTMVSQSRFIWNPFVIPILMVGVLFAFYEVLKKKPHRLPLIYFLIGLMFHFEIAVGIMTLLQFSLFSLILIWKKVINVRHVVWSAGVFLLTQLHFVIFDFRHDFLITKGILATAGGKAPHAITWVYFQHMFGNHWEVFRFVFFSLFPYGNMIWPLLLVLVAGGIVGLSLDKNVSRHLKQFVWFLVSSPIVLFGLYLRYLWPMRDWWLVDMGVVILVLFGIVCGWLYERKGVARIAVVLLFVFFIGSHLYQTKEFYKVDFHDYGGTHKIRGKLDAIDAIYKDAKGAPFNVLVYTPPIYTYPYDYLFWWRGSHTYGYVPGKEKTGIFYLLIEPDGNRPWEYKGWQETVIKTGTVISTWTQTSGFIIEKRKAESL